MIDEDLAWAVEDACFDAWPSLGQALDGCWIAKFAAGVSRRSNSVNLIRHDYDRLEPRIDRFEGLYRSRGQDPLFRILSFLDPKLEAALLRRGWRPEGETVTLVGPRPAQAGAAPDVTLAARPDAGWLDAQRRFQGRSEAQGETYARIVAGLRVPAAFATARTGDGEIAALGYAAVHGDLWCVESVVTGAAFRGRGHARRMLAALGGWAAAQGARTGCLQVQADNAPALRLYASLGFDRELYRYRYLRADQAFRGSA